MINLSITKRQTLSRIGKVLIVLALVKKSYKNHILAANQSTNLDILSIRLWSSADYSRITIESNLRLRYKFSIYGSKKLIIEIANVLVTKSHLSFEENLLWLDPYIEDISTSYQNNATSITIEFKELINPQVYENPPISIYQHRLFIDVYPQQEYDPLDILLAENAYLDQLEQENQTINTKIATGKSDQQLKEMIDRLERQKNGHSQDSLAQFINNKINQSKSNQNINKLKKTTIKRKIVVLDPGHGGEDPGAVGAHNSYEKNVVLAISKYAKKELEKFGYITILTRDRDFFIPLRKRVIKAQKLKADIFISIHADAFTRRGAKGSSVYMLSRKGASSTAAKWLAKKENSSDFVGGIKISKEPSIASTLKDLVETRSQNLSQNLANNVLKELAKINRLHKRSIEKAGFAVLKAPDIPSILVETAFISNPNEERRLNNPDYQKALATAIARGVFRYFTSAA